MKQLSASTLMRFRHLVLLSTGLVGVYSPATRTNEGAIVKISHIQLCTPQPCNILLFHLMHYGTDITLSSGKKCDIPTLTRTQFNATRTFFAERGIDPFAKPTRQITTPQTVILLEVDPRQQATATATRSVNRKSGYENAQGLRQYQNFFLGYFAHAGCPRVGNAVLDCFDNRESVENYLTFSTNVLKAAAAMKEHLMLGVQRVFTVQTNAAMFGSRECKLDAKGLLEQDYHVATEQQLPNNVLFGQWFDRIQKNIDRMMGELAHLCKNPSLIEQVQAEITTQAEALKNIYASWAQICRISLNQFPIQYGPMVFQHLDQLSASELKQASDAVYQFPRAYTDLNLLVTTLRHARSGCSTIIIPAGRHHTQRAVEWLSLLPSTYIKEESQELFVSTGDNPNSNNLTRVLKRLFSPLALARLSYERLPEHLFSTGRPLEIYAPTADNQTRVWQPVSQWATQICSDAAPAQLHTTHPADGAEPR